MKILDALKAKKLNSQITCTSYYDFLTCGCHCLESLNCRDIPSDPSIQTELKSPPWLVKDGVKYFDVEDNAAEWYLGTRALPIKNPSLCRRKCCLSFRVPIRTILGRRTKATTYSGQRVSPEFLCLLKQDHARKRGLDHLPRKYRSRKPGFCYYWYDAEGKRRPMHRFPSRDVTCTCVSPMDRNHRSRIQKSVTCPHAPLRTKEVPKPSGHYPLSARTKRNKKHVVQFTRDTGDKEDIHDKLQEKVSTDKNQDKAGLNTSMTQPLQIHEPPKPMAFRSQPTCNPPENIPSYSCPFGQQAIGSLRSCNYSYTTEYENSPFCKAIQGSSQEGCSLTEDTKLIRCSQSTSDNNNICSACKRKVLDGPGSKEHTVIEVQPGPKKPVCAPPITYHRQLGVDCSQRSHLTNKNGVGFLGNSSGCKGFVHRSEKQKMLDQEGVSIPQKATPHCYSVSGDDPDIRQEEKARVAKFKCWHQVKLSETNPYSCKWSKCNPEIREQGKPRLAENDQEKGTEHTQSPSFSYFSPDKSKASCPCKRTSCPRSVGKLSSDYIEPTDQPSSSNGINLVGAHDSTLASDNEETPQPVKSCGEAKRMPIPILKKLTTDWSRSTPKKARLLPRLHAFAKRFLWSGPKGHQFKSSKSDNERSDMYPNRRKVEKPSSYLIRNLSSGDSDARQRRTPKVGYEKHDLWEKRKQAKSSVTKRITYQDQVKVQDIRGPRDPNLWAKFHQAKARQRSTSPEVYRNSRPSWNEASKATRPNPIRFDPKPRKHSNTPATSGPERASYKRPRYPRKTPHLPPDQSQSSLTNQPCSTECSQKVSSYRKSQHNGTTCQVIQGRATCKSRGNDTSLSGYETPIYPHERYRGQLRVCRVLWEERQERRKAEESYAGCKPFNNYLISSRAPEPPWQKYRPEIISDFNTELQGKARGPSLIQPRGYHCEAVQHPPACKAQGKRRRCDTSCHASTAPGQSKRFCESRRMRGGIDFREDGFVPGMNQDVPHTFPITLSSNSDRCQRVNYTKAGKASRHAFCFD